MIDVAALDLASEYLYERDRRLLHTHRWGNDYQQVDYLSRCYRPRGEVLDAGCGFGEVSRIMVELGVPANFTLLNISAYQLSKCPASMPQFLGTMEDTTYQFPDASFDGVMFNTALLNMDRRAALRETHRVLHPEGHLFLSDVVIPVGINYDAVAMANEMHAHVSRAYDLILALYQNGFRVDDWRLPHGTTDHMNDLGEVVERLFAPLRPIVLRCSRVNLPA